TPEPCGLSQHKNRRYNSNRTQTNKEEVRKHYEKWTQANPLNPEKWSEWATEYEPIQSIDPSSLRY
ncbi:38978_t:CDS:1, partial [Gigaspora margarita]